MNLKRPDSELVKLLRGLALASGIFAFLLSLLIIFNYVQLKKTDPLNSPALKVLQERLQREPGDSLLRQQVRDLDLLARKAFFTGRWQVHIGGHLLLLSLLILAGCLKWLELITPRLPVMPGKPADPWPARISRRGWIFWSGLALITIALVLTFLTYRMLDRSSVPEIEQRSDNSATPAKPGSGPAVPDKALHDTAVHSILPAGPGRKIPADSSGPSASTASAWPTLQELRANFPSFRGQGSLGIDYHRNIPVSWDGPSGKNIFWKTPIPLPGNNSPVIWEKKIFLSGASENKKQIYCVDASNGKIIWTADVVKVPGSPAASPKVTAETGLASSSMATDGQRVYAIFANGDLAAADLEGKIVWSKNLGLPKNHYGYASSLIMYRDLLIVQYDQSGSAKVMGLAGKTGETVWETARDVKISWASPVLANIENHTELILAAEPDIVAYDPATGKELWKLDCISGEVGPSPASAGGLIFALNEYSKLTALRPGNAPVLLWEDNEYLSDVPSPVAKGDFLFVVTSYGTVVCYGTAKGEKLKVAEMDAQVYSSPMISGNKLFVLDKKGIMHIFSADKNLDLLGSPALGEGSVCTPAFADGKIFIRGNKHLFCIGK